MNLIDFLLLVGPLIPSGKMMLNRTVNCYINNEMSSLIVEDFLRFDLWGATCIPGAISGKYNLQLRKYGWKCHNFAKSCLTKVGFKEEDFGPFLSMTEMETKPHNKKGYWWN